MKDPAPSLDPKAPYKFRTNYFYVLAASEVENLASATERLRIDGEIDAAINTSLGELFELIQTGTTEKGLDFLANLVNSDK